MLEKGISLHIPPGEYVRGNFTSEIEEKIIKIIFLYSQSTSSLKLIIVSLISLILY